MALAMALKGDKINWNIESKNATIPIYDMRHNSREVTYFEQETSWKLSKNEWPEAQEKLFLQENLEDSVIIRMNDCTIVNYQKEEMKLLVQMSMECQQDFSEISEQY